MVMFLIIFCFLLILAVIDLNIFFYRLQHIGRKLKQFFPFVLFSINSYHWRMISQTSHLKRG